MDDGDVADRDEGEGSPAWRRKRSEPRGPYILPSLHSLFILSSFSLHSLFILSSFSLHSLFILSSFSLHSLFILSSFSLHSLFPPLFPLPFSILSALSSQRGRWKKETVGCVLVFMWEETERERREDILVAAAE